MTESPCLCGCTTVRKGSRFIGRFQFWMGIFGMLLWFLAVGGQVYAESEGRSEEIRKSMGYQNKYVLLLALSYYFAYLVAWIYGGYILINATFNNNLQKTIIWLKINAVFTIMGGVISIIAIAHTATFQSLFGGLLGFCLAVYMWIVVYEFYKDERPSEATNIDN